MKATLFLVALSGFTAVANAAAATGSAAQAHPVNTLAISMFVVFVAATLAITWWAARRNHSASDHYAAGGRITAWQNGFAIAGDYMSAASILGISALIFTSGYDGLIYSIGFIASWPVIVSLLAERLRNLGRYTFADVASFRLSQKPVRTLAACSSLVIVVLYLISQIVGAGKLVELLFGLQYQVAVIAVGVLMVLYVFFGGMLATTWVQIIKAVLLLGGCAFMSFMVLRHVGFNLNALFREAAAVHPKGPAIMSPGGLVSDPISAVSLGLALIFGTPGLPHILMRFFTVPDAKAARTSVLYATGLIGLGYIMIFVIGYGTIIFVNNDPAFHDARGALLGGVNMVAIHLASAVGGSVFLGFISAVAFSTILAVVAGLALAGASAVSHDLYANVLRNGKATEKEELRVSKLTTLVLGVISIVLGIAFENQNIAFIVSLVFSIAASSNFPVLLLSLYWRGLTTRGTVIGGSLGLGTAVVLMILSPTVWVKVLGNAHALFPYEYPALFSMTVSFVSIWFFSVTDRSAAGAEARARFDAQLVRSETGLGASTTLAH